MRCCRSTRCARNRDLPAELPFGGGHPRLRLVEGAAAVARVACLTAPTATAAPAAARAAASGGWCRICRSAICRWSAAPEGAAGAARRCCGSTICATPPRRGRRSRRCWRSSPRARHRAGARRARRRVLPRARRDAGVRPRGWAGGGLYLLAAVLDRFLALHATVNSFVRTARRAARPAGPRRRLAGARPGRACCCEAAARRADARLLAEPRRFRFDAGRARADCTAARTDDPAEAVRFRSAARPGLPARRRDRAHAGRGRCGARAVDRRR